MGESVVNEQTVESESNSTAAIVLEPVAGEQSRFDILRKTLTADCPIHTLQKSEHAIWRRTIRSHARIWLVYRSTATMRVTLRHGTYLVPLGVSMPTDIIMCTSCSSASTISNGAFASIFPKGDFLV